MSAGECVKNIINTLPKLTDVHEKEMVFRNEGKKYYLTQWDYVWTYYQTIENKDLFLPPFAKVQLPTFIESIYKMALGEDEDLDNWCTGQLTLKTDNILQTQSNSFDYTVDKEDFDSFLDEFHVRLAESNCKFTSLSLNYLVEGGGHRNMILIYKNPKYRRFIMYLYEPEADVQKDVQNFLEYLVLKYNEKFSSVIDVNKNVYPNQCPLLYSKSMSSIGLQNIIKESERGYCIMYSYLWLYIVLKCSSSVNVLELLDGVEDGLISNYSVEQLADIVVSFAGKAVNFYIEDIGKYVSEDVLKVFHEKSIEKFKFIMEKRDSYRRKTKQKKRKQEYREQGEECKQHSDCGSNYCNPVTYLCDYEKKSYVESLDESLDTLLKNLSNEI